MKETIFLDDPLNFENRNTSMTNQFVSRIWMQLLLLGNSLFWASGGNLGLKRPASFCKWVALAAGVQKKAQRFRALKVAKDP